MARYVILNAVFILGILITILGTKHAVFTKHKLATLAYLLLLTAVFDNLIIAAGIVDYNNAHILGIRLLYAPIEDFAYTIAAVIVVPAVYEWRHPQ